MDSNHQFRTKAKKLHFALSEHVLNDIKPGLRSTTDSIIAALGTALRGQNTSIEQFRTNVAVGSLYLECYDLHGDYDAAFAEVEKIGKLVEAEFQGLTPEVVEQMTADLANSPRKEAVRLFVARNSTPPTPSRKSKRFHTPRMNMSEASTGGDVSHGEVEPEPTAESADADVYQSSDVEEPGDEDIANPVKGMKAKNVAPPSTEINLRRLRLVTVPEIDDLKQYLLGAAREGAAQMEQFRIVPKEYYELFLGGFVLAAANTQRVTQLVHDYHKVSELVDTYDGIGDCLQKHTKDPKFIRDIMKGVQAVVGQGRSSTVDSFLALETKLRAARVHANYFGRDQKQTEKKWAELKRLGKLPELWAPLKPGQTYGRRASMLLQEHYNIDPDTVKAKLQPVKVLAAFIAATSTGVLLFADPATIVSKFSKHVTRNVKAATAIGESTANLMPDLMKFFDYFGERIVIPIWKREELKITLTRSLKAPRTGDITTCFKDAEEVESNMETATGAEALEIDAMELDINDISLGEDVRVACLE